jgi:putative transposase
MSWVRIWVHLVFATKNRTIYLNQNIRKDFFQHIKENAQEKGIWLDCVNGYVEHAHCLISMNKDQSISKIAQLIKGESSYWINRNKLIQDKFIWQDDYWVASVSDSHLFQLREYIHHQENHHKKTSFKEELDIYKKKYGLDYINT